MLGTASANPEIHREFIASKSPDAGGIEEEVAAIGSDAATEKAMTVFPKKDGAPFLWDYQLKGFFKDSCSALARVPNTKSNKLKAFRKVIDGTIKCPCHLAIGQEATAVGFCHHLRPTDRAIVVLPGVT